MDPAAFHARYAHFGGFDFARQKHHVVIVDHLGQIVLNQALPETAEDWAKFRQDAKPLFPLAIAIETNNGPAVERLLDMGASGLSDEPQGGRAAAGPQGPQRRQG